MDNMPGIEKKKKVDPEVERRIRNGYNHLPPSLRTPGIEGILKTIVSHTNPSERAAALVKLAKKAKESAIPILSDSLYDSNQLVRLTAIERLGGFGKIKEQMVSHQAFLRLKVKWTRSVDPEERAALLYQFVKFKEKERVLGLFQEALEDAPHQEVCEAAVMNLPKFDVKTAIRMLKKAAKHPIPGVRELAIDGICKLKRDVVPTLVEFLTDPEESVRDYIKAEIQERINEVTLLYLTRRFVLALNGGNKKLANVIKEIVKENGDTRALTLIKSSEDPTWHRHQILAMLEERKKSLPPVPMRLQQSSEENK